ncbi:MAG TPA: hypothetical protein VF556_09395 [Pyrinomonadaceae bacterium]|jgi:hypothetical protein
MNTKQKNKRLSDENEQKFVNSTNVTKKILPDGEIKPIPSVTEKTTGLLSAKRKINSGNL